jgi:hypothetical protein
MRFRLFAVAVVVGLAPLASAGKQENPLKKAKVGDWVEYKMTTIASGVTLDGSSKSTLIAKDEKEATIRTTVILAGKNFPDQEKKIDLTKPLNPLDMVKGPKGDNTVEKGKEGKEIIKIGGKE